MPTNSVLSSHLNLIQNGKKQRLKKKQFGVFLSENMPAVVEKCLSELAKLQEKARPRIVRKPTLSKAKEAAEVEKGRQGAKVVRAETAMSESTVFLLMDRFAPW